MEVLDMLNKWVGRPFWKKMTIHLQSDSSTQGWGLDINSGNIIQDFWREDSILHINVKELKAAMETVKSFSRPGDTVLLSVDNTVTFAYLTKGGRPPHFNQLVRPFLKWCLEHSIQLQVEWVPSENMMADSISRWQMAPGDYSLNQDLFIWILKQFQRWITPTVDVFASPGNTKLEKFISRWPHHQAAAVDALTCPLEKFQELYANPPWSVIAQWLVRLRQNPHLKCLMICPQWVSATWWPLLIKCIYLRPLCWGSSHSKECS